MSVGFFGKVPGHGDFVERGLPTAFKVIWDEWLQHGIASSRSILGEAWLDAYLTSPIWRFALAPGLCGETGWIGVMVPSVDRVGRYFPLTIAASTGAKTIPLQMLVSSAEWHDAAQEVALGALADDTITADVLEEGIRIRSDSVLQQPSIYCQNPAYDPRQSLNARALRLPFSYGSTPGHGLLAFSHRLLEALFGSTHSVWWTHGSDRVQPAMFACPQLPESDAFAGLLEDRSQAASWFQLSGYLLEGVSLEPSANDQDIQETVSQPAAGSDRNPAVAIATAAEGEVSMEGPASSQFGDLIEDAAPASFDAPVDPAVVNPDDLLTSSMESTPGVLPDSQASSPTPSALPEGDDTLVSDPSPSSFVEGGLEPVAVSADEILAGFGEPAADHSEAADAKEDVAEEEARKLARGEDS